MPAPEGYRIRLYDPHDLERLQEITVKTFGAVSVDNNMERAFGRFGNGDWSTRKAADVADDCRLQPDGVLVAVTQDGDPVGFVTTRLFEMSRIGWIHNLAVDPPHQGRGLGRALLQEAITLLRSRGMEIAKIETLEQNAIGQALYPSLGFREVARQIHYGMRIDET